MRRRGRGLRSIGPVCLICVTHVASDASNATKNALEGGISELCITLHHAGCLPATDEGFPYLPQILHLISQVVRIMCKMHLRYIDSCHRTEIYKSELKEMRCRVSLSTCDPCPYVHWIWIGSCIFPQLSGRLWVCMTTASFK